jgi:hypothetical protein
MSQEIAVAQGYGFAIPTNTIRITAKGANIPVGGCFMLDIANTQSTGNTVGSRTGGLATGVTPSATAVKFGVVCIAQEAITQNTLGNAATEGVLNARVKKASGNVAAGDPLYAVASSNDLSADGNVGDRVVAINLLPLTAPTTATLSPVLFSGVSGLGQKVS